MLFIVRLNDRSDALPKRRQHFDAHLEWLRKNENTILVAGSLRPEPDAEPVGGCWIVEAPDKDAVKTLLTSDPFWTHGVRAKVEILHWSKAFPERRALI